MRQNTNKILVSALITLALPIAWVGEAFGFGSKVDTTLNQYEIHFYGETTGWAPDNIIKLENNGEVLLACILGKTSEQLREQGIQISSSQIEVLVKSRLLELIGGKLRTTFPILTPEETRTLRAITEEEGYKLGHKIHKELKTLKEKLLPNKRLKTQFAILASYILEDLVFRIFKEKGFLEDAKITTVEPTWSGLVWAVYPPRGFSYKTHTVSHQEIDFRIYWSDAALSKVEPLIKDQQSVFQLINGYLKKGKITSERAKQALMPYHLFDSSGNITIPIIVEKRSDPLYEQCLPIAKAVADYVTKVLDLNRIGKKVGIHEEKQTLLIVYYELIWDMMQYLESRDLIQKPAVLASPEKAQPKDVGDLVFLVTKERIRGGR